jgi:hypothetical protein
VENSKFNIIIVAVLIAAGLALSGYFIGQTMYNAKVAINTATVKGLAERVVESDRADWMIIYSVNSTHKEDIPQLYTQAEKNQKIIIDLLLDNGIKNEEITIGTIDYDYIAYRDENQKVVDEQHRLKGDIQVSTQNIHLIANVRQKVNKLLADGISVTSSNPTYRFTKLNDIKPEMLEIATKNARVAANEFAKNAGTSVGRIYSAQQGNFSIQDLGQDYSDTNEIKKVVRVITTITFYLKD